MRHLLVAITAFAVVSCGERRAQSAGGDTANTSHMSGMSMDVQGIKMISPMRAHLDSMRSASPHRMKAMMATHQEMASRMMDAMGSDMRMMSMQGDSTWTALADSVRRDLAEFPGLSGDAFSSRMKEYLDRMGRLIDQHEGMMK